MPTPITGTLRPLSVGFEARIRIDDAGTKKGFALLGFPPKDEESARARCTEMATMAVRMRRAGQPAKRIVDLLTMAAKARGGKPWEAIVAAVDALCAEGGAVALDATKALTFVAFATEWTDGALHKRWPDHVTKKDATQDARFVRLYIEPVIKDLLLIDFTLDHAEQIMANLPEDRSSALRRHVAQVVRRVCKLAVYPARHLKEMPIPTGWMPKVKRTKAFTYLYPDEDRALLGCAPTDDAPGVPLWRRLFFGVLAREGMRRDELASLRWQDLDLARGHVALDENKTDDPRSWALDPGVARALSAWKVGYCADASPADPVIAVKGAAFYVGHAASDLRADLKAAGLTREQLFERSATRRPLRVHDLRATFVTVSLANGRSETWVADRTGHRSSEMINRYRRAARTWSELSLGTLAPLDEAIPELTDHERTTPLPTRRDSDDLGGAIARGNGRTAKTRDGSTDWKSCGGASLPRVRISSSPLESNDNPAAHESATHERGSFMTARKSTRSKPR